MPLTDAAIKAAKPRQKPYRLFDAKGLYLVPPVVAAGGALSTAYADQSRSILASYPAARIRALLTKARSSLPPEVLASIHLDEQNDPAN
jgi:hypothetical protein